MYRKVIRLVQGSVVCFFVKIFFRKMPKDKRGRTKLSKSVLEMKFMQRSKQRILAEKEVEESQAIHSKDITEGMKSDKDRFILESSFVPCLNLILGRVSYGGMNPEVEKLMRQDHPSNPPLINREMDKDISDWEMFKASSVAQTMANKFTSKKDRSKNTKKLTNEHEEEGHV